LRGDKSATWFVVVKMRLAFPIPLLSANKLF